MKPLVTLDQLVHALIQDAESPEEVVATAVHMVNSGAVDLVGTTSASKLDARRLAELDEYLLAA